MTMTMAKLSAIVVLFLILVIPVLAQEEQTSTADQAAEENAAAPDDEQELLEQDLQELLEEPGVGETYRYDPQGRRDPFRSLIGPKSPVSREDAPPGVPGFMIDEVDLTGIIRIGQGFVGLVKGPDNVGYSIRTGDELFDGEVVRITENAVVFRQEVNDPTSIERHREVVKELKNRGT